MRPPSIVSTKRASRLPLAALLIALFGLSACAAPGRLASDDRVRLAQGDKVLAAAFDAVDPVTLLLAQSDVLPDDVDAPALDLDVLATRVHAEVNRVRAEHGLPALGWTDALRPVAQAHSRDMADHAYFSHINRRGDGPTERARRSGITPRVHRGNAVIEGVGENLFLTHRYVDYRVLPGGNGKVFAFTWKSADALAAQTVAAWLDSPGHRQNLLSPLYLTQAIGLATGPGHTLFVTQNLSPSK